MQWFNIAGHQLPCLKCCISSGQLNLTLSHALTLNTQKPPSSLVAMLIIATTPVEPQHATLTCAYAPLCHIYCVRFRSNIYAFIFIVFLLLEVNICIDLGPFKVAEFTFEAAVRIKALRWWRSDLIRVGAGAHLVRHFPAVQSTSVGHVSQVGQLETSTMKSPPKITPGASPKFQTRQSENTMVIF